MAIVRTCAQCGEDIENVGRGRPKRWCGDSCRLAWHRAQRAKGGVRAEFDRTCRTCGDPMRRGTGTLPQGEAECRPCRRKRMVAREPQPEPFSEQRACKHCGHDFVAKQAHQVYCTPECRNRRWGRGRSKVSSTTERGYGAAHRKAREHWAPTGPNWTGVCAEIVCLNPNGRWMDPDAPWDLAHDHANGGYLGPAHPKCNRTEGGKRSTGAGWANRLTKLLVRWCPTCGVEFETKYPRQTYCTARCRPR